MKDIVQQRLDQYQATSMEAEELAIKEITQEILLFALSASGFFHEAAFVGGTALRILHGLDRFSEDLDFSLQSENTLFALDDYLESAAKRMTAYGYQFDISAPQGSSGVTRRMMRDNALTGVLDLRYSRDLRKKIRVKVEVDTRPPEGARSTMEYHLFPQDFTLKVHTPESLFAGKMHALLCRPFIKGRDWYDLGWFVRRGVPVNGAMLKSALHQAGPWKGQELEVAMEWVVTRLSERIRELDWEEVRRDVSPLLGPGQREALENWSEALFLKKAAMVRVV